MKSLYLLLCSIFLLSSTTFAQIVIPGNSTLLDAAQNTANNDTNQMKAFLSILQTHPELQNYYILSFSQATVNTTGIDYYITLKGPDGSTVMAVVSLQLNLSSFIVSFIKIDSAGNQVLNSPTFSTAQQGASTTINNIQSSQAIFPNSSPNIPVKSNKTLYEKALGGFRPLPSLNDPKFLTAMNYLQQIHSNLMNYEVKSGEYQVVTGVNYLINYVGLDQTTKITAKVFIGLDGVPSEIQFNVTCQQTVLIDCTTELANQIYFGNEFIINSHPELKNYRISSIYIEQRTGSEVTFMTTFENTQMLLRAISEVIVTPKSTKVMSFYSYRYQ